MLDGGGGGKYSVDETVEAGLPNITGSFYDIVFQPNLNDGNWFVEGAFYNKKNTSNSRVYANDEVLKAYKGGDGTGFDASRCSSIYGASDTVQPPAYTVYVYKRIA